MVEVARDAATGPKRRRPAKDTEAAAAAEKGRRISAAGEAANLETAAAAAAALHAMAKTLLQTPPTTSTGRQKIGLCCSLLDWSRVLRGDLLLVVLPYFKCKKPAATCDGGLSCDYALEVPFVCWATLDAGRPIQFSVRA